MDLKELFSSLCSLLDKNTILVLLLTVLLLLLYSSSDGPPGPSLWQLLPNGEVYPMLRDAGTTVRTLTSLQQKYGLVYSLWLGFHHAIITGDTADVAQVVASPEFRRASSVTTMFHEIAPGGILSMHGETHARIRKALKTNLNFSIVENCHSFLTDAVKELCSSLALHARQGKARNALNLPMLLSTTTFRIILSLAFGRDLSKEKRECAYHIVEDLIDVMFKDLLGHPIKQGLTPLGIRNGLFKLRDQIHDVGRELISERLTETPDQRTARPTDALDAVVALDDDERRILSMALELMFAGSHTTSQAVSWCIYELCCNPDAEEKIIESVNQKDKPLSEWLTVEDVKGMDYLNKVWKESNRMHPPIAFLIREANVNTQLRGSGVRVEKGKYVVAFIHGVHNRGDLWGSPEKFRPERWESGGEGESIPHGAYLPFGLGAMNCIGKFLADYEGPLILAEMYRRFRFRLACRPEEIVSYTEIVESPRYQGKEFEGVPVHIEMK